MAFRDPAPIKLTEVKKEVVRLADDKQNKNSSNLTTKSKNIEGAINELKTKSDTLTSNSALKSTQIIAGNGLQGGGTLEQNRTLSIKGANDSITASSSGMAVNTYNGVNSTSTTRPASANALKITYDKLVATENTANSKLSKAGDTMSGNISFSNQGTSFVGLKGSVGDDDGWRIVGGSTVGNVGELEIATGFSGNQPIYVRQYNGTNYSTIARTLTLLDANGNTIFPGTLTASKISGTLTGNASTATSLQTARTINGTSFNGTANITTANWGTARTITIGKTGKSVNGSANISWSLTEIGALPLTGGTLTTSAFIGLTIKRSSADGSAISYNNSNGQLGNVGFLRTGEFVVNKASDETGNYMKISSSAVSFGSKTVSATTFSGALSGNASTATKLATARTINGVSFDGTSNITIYDNTKYLSTKYTATQDANNIKTTGIYSIKASLTNAPTTSHGTLIVDFDVGTPYQIWIPDNTHVSYKRTCPSGTWGSWSSILANSISGNASTASTLQTARTLTIGNTGKSFNGSANISWSHAELGVARMYNIPNSATSISYSRICAMPANIGLGQATLTALIMGGTQFGSTQSPLIKLSFSTRGYSGSGTIPSTCVDAVSIGNASTIGDIKFFTKLNGSNVELWMSAAPYPYPIRMVVYYSNQCTFYCDSNTTTAPSGTVTTHTVARAYTTAYKPSAADVGALATSGGTVSGNLTVTGAIVANGNVTAYSDRKLKSNIIKIENALDKICSIGGYTFDMLGTGQRQTGVIAQELEKVLPEAVIKNDNGYLSVDYGRVVGLLIEGIKDLKQEIDELKGGK